jgi:hypothetical protein
LALPDKEEEEKYEGHFFHRTGYNRRAGDASVYQAAERSGGQ